MTITIKSSNLGLIRLMQSLPVSEIEILHLCDHFGVILVQYRYLGIDQYQS